MLYPKNGLAPAWNELLEKPSDMLPPVKRFSFLKPFFSTFSSCATAEIIAVPEIKKTIIALTCGLFISQK
jgi:hypothetical protein